jgi:renalase
VQQPGELAALHPWTVRAIPAGDVRAGRDGDEDEDDAEATRTLTLMGAVGVPSMRALAQTVAQPLDIRLRTPIRQAQRRGARWRLRDAAGEIDEDFQALVLAIPAPLALPLALESPELAAALRAVQYRSRWVLLLGSERPVGLPAYREFQGSPIERVAAMHSKPGRAAGLPQRWFVEADERWSLQHEQDDAETVAELLLDNFRAHACRQVMPNYVRAFQWRHAFAATPVSLPGHTQCLWDPAVRLGVCGDSVVPSRVDRVHASGVALAQAMADGVTSRRDDNAVAVRGRPFSQQLAAQL